MKFSYLDAVITERGLTRKDLAERINMSYGALSKRIIGLVEFKLSELRNIAIELNLSVEEFRNIFLK